MNKNGTLLQVEGNVQGVGFRYATQEKARQLGLRGYVRNRQNGTVEIAMAGPLVAQTALENWLHEGGPRLAKITKVTRTTTSFPEDVSGFIIK